MSVNQTAQLGNNLRTRLAYNNSWGKRTGLLPALTGSDAASTNYAIDRTSPNWSLSGHGRLGRETELLRGRCESATTSRTSSTKACRQ